MITVNKNIVAYAIPTNSTDPNVSKLHCNEIDDKDAVRIKKMLDNGEIKANTMIPCGQTGGTRWVNMINVIYIDIKDDVK